MATGKRDDQCNHPIFKPINVQLAINATRRQTYGYHYQCSNCGNNHLKRLKSRPPCTKIILLNFNPRFPQSAVSKIFISSSNRNWKPKTVILGWIGRIFLLLLNGQKEPILVLKSWILFYLLLVLGSVVSEICALKIEYAIKLNKRLVPVV